MELSFCEAATSHAPPRFAAIMVIIPYRGFRGEPSGFLSPATFQVQCTMATSGCKNRASSCSSVIVESLKRPESNRVWLVSKSDRPCISVAPTVTKSTPSAMICASAWPSCFAQASQKSCGIWRTVFESAFVWARTSAGASITKASSLHAKVFTSFRLLRIRLSEFSHPCTGLVDRGESRSRNLRHTGGSVALLQ
jgi:hypothetical protein